MDHNNKHLIIQRLLFTYIKNSQTLFQFSLSHLIEPSSDYRNNQSQNNKKKYLFNIIQYLFSCNLNIFTRKTEQSILLQIIYWYTCFENVFFFSFFFTLLYIENIKLSASLAPKDSSSSKRRITKGKYSRCSLVPGYA